MSPLDDVTNESYYSWENCRKRKMRIEFNNGSIMETLDIESENIVRSRRGEEQIQHYSQYIDEILKSFELKWYQKLYLKLRYKIFK